MGQLRRRHRCVETVFPLQSLLLELKHDRVLLLVPIPHVTEQPVHVDQGENLFVVVVGDTAKQKVV